MRLVKTLILLLLVSCGSGEENGQLNAINSSNPPNQTDNDIETPLDEKESEAGEYVYNREKHVCLNHYGDEGKNSGKVSACGDVKDEKIANEDLSKKNLWLLDLRGTMVVESKVHFVRLTDAEVLVDENTLFDGYKNPFKKIFKAQVRSYQKIENKIAKLKKRLAKQQRRLQKLIKKYKKLKKGPKKEKLLSRIKKAKTVAQKLKRSLKLVGDKRSRHKRHVSSSYQLLRER